MTKLSRPVVVLFVVVTFAPKWVNSQTANPQWPDSPSHTREVSGETSDSPSNREVSWRSLPKDFLHDQKGIWVLFPAHLPKRHYCLPTLPTAASPPRPTVAHPHPTPY